MILALDLGTKTGWAVKDRDGQISSGTFCVTVKKNNHPATRWIEFRKHINLLLENYNVNTVIYEQVFNHAGIRASHVYGAYEAILVETCFIRNCELKGVGVGTVKKFATGRGNASKDQMIEAARHFGFDPVDHNQADAIHILRYAVQS